MVQEFCQLASKLTSQFGNLGTRFGFFANWFPKLAIKLSPKIQYLKKIWFRNGNSQYPATLILRGTNAFFQKMKNILLEIAEGMLGLFYPKLCLACGENSQTGNDLICANCQIYMPQTNLHESRENEFTQKFMGRVPIETGASFFYYSKELHTRRLIHQLKYSDKPELAVQIGRVYGEILKKSPHFHGIELIVPVPLHPKKEWQRGYNQAAKFGEGLSEGLGIEQAEHGMRRIEHRESQTKKRRTARHTNARQLYEVADAKKLAGKHVLLVDDVLTTGATLENCAQYLSELPGIKISMATIAMGRKHQI